jgi:hypothetical protein
METQRYSFEHWLRTGRLILLDARWGRREVKFNPNHDPKTGRFTFKDGAGLAEDDGPKTSQGKGDGSWAGGGFTGGGGGSSGGGGASASYITYDGAAQYQAAHPGRDPYLAQPGDTVASIAAEHHVDISTVEQLNGLAANSAIKPGTVLALPAGSLQYDIKNGYAFGLDAVDRTQTVTGQLHLADDPQRSRASQAGAGGGDRLPSDDGGHFIAARFGGPTDAFNHFAQDASFNRGTYRAVEDSWATDLRAGSDVSVDIVAHYPGQSRRPDSLTVKWTVDGHARSRFFLNGSKGR